ncbi:Zn-finger domain-containing protein [Clostridium putrefaciens]|uniref:Zn-finger domain-containing protein n=1 Tax=Clostridium putrefaciens TaxID=99675 RepID=A0A381J9E8_9CLOT|nr:hypothetical protein [Clostridium putrefaciens]SUY47027.1 Zn-finger domain-containing protein [Clostridium putrefaciens]
MIAIDKNKNKLSNYESSTEDDMCDLAPNKVCDNCFKCLDPQESEVRSINMEDLENYVLEGDKFPNNSENLKSVLNDNASNYDSYGDNDKTFNLEDINDSFVEEVDNKKVYFIEDLEDVKGILDNESDFNSLATEAYPGLIILKGKE